MKPKVIEAKIADLHPYDHNPRVNDEAVPVIVNSIKEFGFIGAIIIKADTYCELTSAGSDSIPPSSLRPRMRNGG